jgi:4-alpha-glucanotransferase
MNEMGALSCPYDSVSSFALEPVYLSLKDPYFPKSKSLSDAFKDLQRHLPLGKKNLDYAVKKQKLLLAQEIFSKAEEGNSSQLGQFRDENANWLLDFALYKVLKSHQGGQPWYDWEEKFRERDRRALEDFKKGHTEEIDFQIWMQWQLYRQLKEVKAHAAEKGILIKGDMPLLVSRDSADVWAHREFFKLLFSAGAPPDMYCARGQRWGMPTYDWGRIAADDYRYLKARLKYAQNFYDILRIDHVVGLFRIWSIPYGEPLENKGLNGFFDPGDESQWPGHGRDILRALLGSTDMLLCAEDLGVIPQVCTDTLREFGIPGNEVQRWAKDYKIKHDFLKPQDYRPFSVAMLSTHDTTNWPAWYEFEAGTVDEGLFVRRCSDHRNIGCDNVKMRLFDFSRSCFGRLRWQDNIDCAEKLIAVLGRSKEELADFLEMYENSFHEKEKLWGQMRLEGKMRQRCDSEILKSAFRLTLESESVFCINSLIDWLFLAGLFKGNPHQYRINTPGTISPLNWSFTLPISLEELLKHKINKTIRQMISAAGREAN